MSKVSIGTCSICGGMVTVPQPWHGTIPPTPTCESCGAVAAEHGPVIPMKPTNPDRRGTTTDMTVWKKDGDPSGTATFMTSVISAALEMSTEDYLKLHRRSRSLESPMEEQ